MSADHDTHDAPIQLAPAAWRRPGLVALLYLHRAIFGLALALPTVAALGFATSRYPRAQAALFDPGAMMLLESLRVSRRTVPPVVWSSSTVALAAAAIGLVPLAMAIAGLGRQGRLLGAFLLGRAWAHAGTLALLFGLTLAAQVVTAAILMLLGGKLIDATHIVPPAEDLAFAALILVVLAVVSVIGVIRDLAYASAVHHDRGLYTATSRAIHAFRERPARTFLAWAWRAGLGLVLLVLAAWLTPPARDASTGMIALGFLIHQVALFAAAFARASWLAAAIRTLQKSAT